jgi:ATP-dependent RNA helicase RhlE
MAAALLACCTAAFGLSNFAALGLRPPLTSAAEQQSWLEPTTIQQQAIPAILEGNDLWAEAPTGSGKTAAFALPILQTLLDRGPQRRGRNGIRTLILSPTRELVVQTAATFSALLDDRRSAKVVALHGGVSINPQLRSLAGGADIVVATPGRLLDVLDNNGASVDGVETLLLDEADRLLAPQFAFELESIVARLPPPGERQTLLFSATFPFKSRPKASGLLAPAYVKLTSDDDSAEYVCSDEIDVQNESEADEEGSSAEGVDDPRKRRRASSTERYASAAPPSTIAQRAICVDLRDRTPLLRHLIDTESWRRVLVFVGSQKRAEHVAMKLSKHGYDVATLHGGLSQEVRAARLDALRSYRLRVLIATDLAARGLDVVGLEAIVNYELPRSTSDYTHRVGRTGRAGVDGVALSFVASTGAGNDAHFGLIERRHGGMTVPREVIEGFEPKAIERLFHEHAENGDEPSSVAATAGVELAAAAGEDDSSVLPSAPLPGSVPGVRHSELGLAHDRMHGGVKGRRMSKKDKIRAAAAAAARQAEKQGAKQGREEQSGGL